MRLKITELPLQSAIVLVRTDFNVPLKDGKVSDNSRIVAAIPTLRYLRSQGCRLVLMSHLGRPKGKKSPEFSLKPVADELNNLGIETKMAPDCIGDEVEKMVHAMKPDDVLLLENLRFYAAEEKPETDPTFAQKLAKLGEFYIDDAFGCAHRAHASIVGVPKLFPKKSAAGFLMEKEIEMLSKTLKNPARPFMALIGGAKVSSKLGVLKALVQHVDTLAIGGAMAFTFLQAEGTDVGASLVEPECFKDVHEIIAACHNKGVDLLLPMDVVVARSVDEPGTKVVCSEIPSGYAGFDIGLITVKLFTDAINESKTILWNGPMGVFEKPFYAKGTMEVGKAFANSGAITIAGGGDTLAALQEIPGKEKITHLSTGGGASLEFLEFGTLPGIEALEVV